MEEDMKRSKALILIANQLDFLNNKFEGTRYNFTKKELNNADVILTTLEEAGMLPPAKQLCHSLDTSIINAKWEKE